jgi:hypothetical protein
VVFKETLIQMKTTNAPALTAFGGRALLLFLAFALCALGDGNIKPKKVTPRAPKYPTQKVDPKTYPKEAEQIITLQRARDFFYAGGNIGCPDCKDMYCSTVRTPSAGSLITSIQTVAQRPTTNNHWYRCQVAAQCGRPEFSDPYNHRLGCEGKSECDVCRVTDDGVGSYEDDIRITYR